MMNYFYRAKKKIKLLQIIKFNCLVFKKKRKRKNYANFSNKYN